MAFCIKEHIQKINKSLTSIYGLARSEFKPSAFNFVATYYLGFRLLRNTYYSLFTGKLKIKELSIAKDLLGEIYANGIQFEQTYIMDI